MCGGTICGALPITVTSGLSPRVRGNREALDSRWAKQGSIPACAGEPKQAVGLPRRLRVYPRVCGGTEASCRLTSPLEGLSPRVRGNPDRPALQRQCSGSIPACAGEPPALLVDLLPARVYPRVCGGTFSNAAPIAGCMGLSPRVRGNPKVSQAAVSHAGSIPACAGEPTNDYPLSRADGVYPRVCGGTTRIP